MEADRKKRVLVVYNYILHYREPFFNELSKKYDVTVIHSGKAVTTSKDSYSELLPPVKKNRTFLLAKRSFKRST